MNANHPSEWTVMTSIGIYRTYWSTEVMRESFKEVGILNSEASCRILVWHVSDATHKPLNKFEQAYSSSTLVAEWSQNGAPKSWTRFLGQLVTWYDVIMVAHRIFGVSDQFWVWVWDFKSLSLEVLWQAERPPEFHHCKARGFSRRLNPAMSILQEWWIIYGICRICVFSYQFSKIPVRRSAPGPMASLRLAGSLSVKRFGVFAWRSQVASVSYLSHFGMN